MEIFLNTYWELIVIILSIVLFMAFFKSMWIIFRYFKSVVNYFKARIFRSKEKY